MAGDQTDEQTGTQILGDWLEELRERKGTSRRALAGALQTDKKNVYRWLDGENEPGALNLLSLFAALGVVIMPPPPAHIPVSLSAEYWAITHELWSEWEKQLDEAYVGSEILAEAATGADSPELVILARHLRSLEEKVERAGDGTGRAIRALTRAIERLERRLDEEGPQASSGG